MSGGASLPLFGMILRRCGSFVYATCFSRRLFSPARLFLSLCGLRVAFPILLSFLFFYVFFLLSSLTIVRAPAPPLQFLEFVELFSSHVSSFVPLLPPPLRLFPALSLLPSTSSSFSFFSSSLSSCLLPPPSLLPLPLLSLPLPLFSSPSSPLSPSSLSPSSSLSFSFSFLFLEHDPEKACPRT